MPIPLDNVSCLDFEASALDPGSYPIEVALADCATGECRTWLIRPTQAWLASGLWDPASAMIHCIPREELIAFGLPVEQVARELTACCTGRVVVADGGTYDRGWLDTLYSSAGMEPGFELEDHDRFAVELALRAGRRPEIALVSSDLEARIRFPRTHRAAADARSLAECLRLIAGWP